MKRISTIILFTFFSVFIMAQNTAMDINEKLGRGVNFGNMFESDISGGWGAPVYPYYFEEIADKGFSHIRVPIKWSDYALTSPPYTIEQAFIDTIKTVVDLALQNKLMIIINMHHYDEIFDDPVGHTERFLAMWDQISLAFKDYSDSVLFELLNEPHANLNQAKWNALFPLALDTVRKDNPTRKVVIGPPDWNGIGSVNKLTWPDSDTNLIMTVHYYNPFQFTHQGASWVDGADAWLGTKWDSTASQMQAVYNDFTGAINFFESKNVPVYVGEFGSYSTADMASRKKWTAYVARSIENYGFSWAYWEFDSGFGIYDPADGIWRNELLNALTQQTDPNSVPPDPWEIGNSGFERGLIGWFFNVQGGAVATLNAINGEAVINITDPAGQSWYVQLIQSGLELIIGADYRFSFDGRFEGTQTAISPYLGKSTDPWTGYSGNHSYTLTETNQTFSFDFRMTNPTDRNARIAFNLSTAATKIILDNITLELLSLPTLVTQIILTPDPAEISTEAASIQLSASIEPSDATIKTVKWEVVSGNNLAGVSGLGKVIATGSADGTATVRASATDDSGVYADIDVVISNQNVGMEDFNMNSFRAWKNGQMLEYILPVSNHARTISLYSIDGRKVYAGIVDPGANSGTISMNQLESNIYILEISGEDEREILKIAY